MPKRVSDLRKAALVAMDAGIAEANRRELGNFDGLLGNFDPEASDLLRDILSRLRDYLLDRYADDEARALLDEYEPRPGYRNLTPVDDDVLLAIDLLNKFRSAVRTSEDKHPGWPTFTELIFGKAGARDRKRQAGVRGGGAATGKQRKKDAADRHAEWRREADELVKSGKRDPRSVVRILAKRKGVDESTIRRGLKTGTKTRTS